MKTFEQTMNDYAELVVRRGVNLQPGQILVLRGPVSAAPFIRRIAERAYAMDVGEFYVDWTDDTLNRLRLAHSPLQALERYPSWKSTAYADLCRSGAAFLTVHAPNPDNLAGIEADRLSVSERSRKRALQVFYDYTMADRVPWSVVSIATPAWATRVFPSLPEKAALDKLWQSIFMATHVDNEEAINAWQAHSDELVKRVERLNETQFRRLMYTAPGTDLAVELPSNHVWSGGRALTTDGVPFSPNIPTEEVFTAPHRLGVSGTLAGSRPVLINGTLVDGISLRFKGGRIVEARARVGDDALRGLIETDEGSHYLGEVALVPNSSPISQLDVLFYDTLYDENASSHFAVGGSYPFCLSGGTGMTDEALLAKGMNQSLMHVDFMVGSAHMDIDAETSAGERIPLMRQGDWVW